MGPTIIKTLLGLARTKTGKRVLALVVTTTVLSGLVVASTVSYLIVNLMTTFTETSSEAASQPDGSNGGADGCVGNTDLNVTQPIVTGPVSVQSLSAAQIENGARIYVAVVAVAKGQKWDAATTRKAATITLATAMQESSLGTGTGWNQINSDSTAGFYQQMTRPGRYGTLQQVTDPVWSTQAFLLGVKHPGSRSSPAWPRSRAGRTCR